MVMVDPIHACKPGTILTFCGVFARKATSTKDVSKVTCKRCLSHDGVMARLVEEKFSPRKGFKLGTIKYNPDGSTITIQPPHSGVDCGDGYPFTSTSLISTTKPDDDE